MSKTANLRPGSRFRSWIAVELSLLLNPWASMLRFATHPIWWDPNKVLAAGRHPSGGSVITPILLAPSPYKSCFSTKPT